MFDGCLELALNIDILQTSDNIITLNEGITNSLNSVNQMIDKFNEFLFLALKNDSLAAAVTAAREGAESTAQMLKAKAGRSSYLNSDNLEGVKDPGAVAVEHVFAIFK